ncbi:uncharacterized protein PHALS_04203 [Plasmopara halstedii]|uniref:Uncharacterized protein n=1 Tax=Plasmopara halstedii TaxID=4781 RepID=A0A0P1A9R0_PLAHL|nr:uncharacterized protein PHALS_04203 [Plasmopara halstedii]CEG36954.1 hypothetical protein PHALS_04203 [Plasmopara halstedii]|eukprot:XP_024573323.1 hypothetical protein PHALS_04203 [Plasmopara halstedii]
MSPRRHHVADLVENVGIRRPKRVFTSLNLIKNISRRVYKVLLTNGATGKLTQIGSLSSFRVTKAHPHGGGLQRHSRVEFLELEIFALSDKY